MRAVGGSTATRPEGNAARTRASPNEYLPIVLARGIVARTL